MRDKSEQFALMESDSDGYPLMATSTELLRECDQKRATAWFLSISTRSPPRLRLGCVPGVLAPIPGAKSPSDSPSSGERPVKAGQNPVSPGVPPVRVLRDQNWSIWQLFTARHAPAVIDVQLAVAWIRRRGIGVFLDLFGVRGVSGGGFRRRRGRFRRLPLGVGRSESA